MKTGRTLTEIAAELQRQSESKRDFVADTRALVVRVEHDDIVLSGTNTVRGSSGYFGVGNQDGLPIRDTAHQQIAGSLGIPKPYYDRLREQAPDLLATNVNHWFQAQPGKKLVRTLDGHARAFLSDRFRPLDNYDLAEAVLPKLQALNARVESAEVTERRFYLKAVTPRVQGEVKRGDVIQAGLVVSNSEIGHGALKVEEMDFRLVCLNGMIRAHAVRRAHLGRTTGGDADLIEDAREYFGDATRRADDRAFFLKLQDTVGAMFNPERFQKRLTEYQEAADRPIKKDPIEVVEVISKRYTLSKEEGGGVLRHLLASNDLSAWGLGNAITRASQDVTDYEEATRLEEVGGQVIELAPSDWRALAV